MSNDLTALREHIRTLVATDDLQAFTTAPTRVSPPCVFVAPGDPYITREGANFRSSIVSHQVVVVGPTGVSDSQAEHLDELVLQVLAALDEDDDLWVGEVGRPGQITLGAQSYLAAPIDVRTERNL